MAPPLLRSERPETGSAAPAASHSPVFVDQSGTRGRRLRGFGWLVGLASAMVAAALTSSLIGLQSQAPALQVPPQPSSTITSPWPSATGLPAAFGSPMGSPPPATGSASAPASGHPVLGHVTGSPSAAGHPGAGASASAGARSAATAAPTGKPAAAGAHPSHSSSATTGTHAAKPQPTAQPSHH
ncbi:hypothetical protein ACFC1R_26160 [Kitasatospora sp. NPDC056138]|uniref:hypothetical protein n=1 Tax=Kitasatospora sp. NPDC056138 TaxID=3345724 RepID=UPI0035D861B2